MFLVSARNRAGRRFGSGCLGTLLSRPDVCRQAPRSIAGEATTTGPGRFVRRGKQTSQSIPKTLVGLLSGRKVLVLLNDPYSLDLGPDSYIPVSVSTHVRAGDVTNSSFIQMQYDLLNGQPHAASTPLAVAADGGASPTIRLGPVRRRDPALPGDAEFAGELCCGVPAPRSNPSHRIRGVRR